MSRDLTIGRVAALTGLSARTIRFYEDGGYVPPPARRASGYRSYSQADVRRLKLVKLARVLGLPLAEIKLLVEQAFAADCAGAAAELSSAIKMQQVRIADRIAELQALAVELDDMNAHVEHCDCEPGSTLADCEYCGLLA